MEQREPLQVSNNYTGSDCTGTRGDKGTKTFTIPSNRARNNDDNIDKCPVDNGDIYVKEENRSFSSLNHDRT